LTLKDSIKYKLEENVNTLVTLIEIPGVCKNERKEYLKDCDGVIIVFDEFESTKTDEIESIFNLLKKLKIESVFVISTKSDLGKTKVKSISLEGMLEKLKIPFFETSAKENQNVNETFHTILNTTRNSKLNETLKQKVNGSLRKGLFISSVHDDELEDMLN
jgi:signal recognition particle receptor subunit beta